MRATLPEQAPGAVFWMPMPKGGATSVEPYCRSVLDAVRQFLKMSGIGRSAVVQFGREGFLPNRS